MASKKANPMLKPGKQPIRATQPFQLRQGSPARKSPSSSPTPRSSGDSRVRNRWPEHRTSPDRSDRKSPSSPSIKVSNRRSPSPSIRRTASLDTIAVPYLTGQWPRDVTANSHQHAMRDKMTQTPDWGGDVLAQQQQTLPMISGGKSSGRSTPTVEQDLVPQMRKQLRTNAKRSSDKKERSPPVHANHSALYQLQGSLPRSNPISITAQAFGKIPRRQNSIEGLNKEIDMFISNDGAGHHEPRYVQGLTPPDGHRAPFPRTSSTRTMETQTTQDNFSMETTKEESDTVIEIVAHTPPSSPTEQQQQPIIASNLTRNPAEGDAKEAGISPYPKYAPSPRPNNSYKFKREPPEGAENVRPFKEQDSLMPVFPSCPDTGKINFFKSTSSAFSPLPSKLLHLQALSVTALGSDQAVGGLHPNSLHPVSIINNSNVQTDPQSRSPLSTLHTIVDA